MSRLRALWWRVSASLWFVPGMMVLGATLLAVLLVDLDGTFQLELAERWPRLFGAGAEGAREMLSAIAGSMITVAGVVFSVTLVALSLASQQYSPRVLRSFMADRPTQAVLGVFVGVFAYCLVVLRTIRGGEEEFVAPLAVLGGMALAFVAIGFLVFFIHHLAASIQASSILDRVRIGTLQAVEELFPENLGEEVDEAAEEADAAAIRVWTPVAARASGYIVTVDNGGLLAFAAQEGRVVRMDAGVGDFVISGQPIASLEGREPPPEDRARALNACYSLDIQRTIEQDSAFGLQQMVDIGLKALSPGINDPATAILAIDRITEVLALLAERRVERRCRRDDRALRVIARGPTFVGLMELAHAALRENGAGHYLVLLRLLWSVEQVAAATRNPHRLAVLATAAQRVADCARRGLPAAHERDAVILRAARLNGKELSGRPA
jgi:uncharacterized membrane protein